MDRFTGAALDGHRGSQSGTTPFPLPLLAILFIVFFAIYETSLASRKARFPEEQTAWKMFGADNREDLYALDWKSPAAKKHPLFPLVATPLYLVGLAFSPSPSGTSTDNYALSFPLAIIGAVDVCLFYLLLTAHYPNARAAIIFTVLYGISASKWIFSSIPETYALSALCTTVFLLVLNRTGTGSWSVACANAVACYASPHLLMLAVIPWLHQLSMTRWTLESFRTCAIYASRVALLFVLPYQVMLVLGSDSTFAKEQITLYGSLGHLLQPDWWIAGACNLVIYSVAAPVVFPFGLYLYPRNLLLALPWEWLLLPVVWLVFLAFSFWGLRWAPLRQKHNAAALVAYLCLYATFFVFFNPQEFFLYTLPGLPVLLLLAYSGYVRFGHRRLDGAATFLLVWIAFNNAALIRLLHTL